MRVMVSRKEYRGIQKFLVVAMFLMILGIVLFLIHLIEL